MNSILGILKQIQKKISCPVCKNNFNIKEIKLRGFFDSVYIFQTVCANKHKPIVTLFVVSCERKNNPISKQDLEKFKISLVNFNGDFRKLL